LARAKGRRAGGQLHFAPGDDEFGASKPLGKILEALDRRLQLARSLAIKLDRPPRIVHFIFGLMAHSIPFIVADMPEADAFQLHSAFSARQLPLSAL
jgi:hypothetical protein